ncbi:DNA polymerase III subunit delta' [Alteromonas ponticola]|uniref:DNA-directed DNA polymerase n=1 Tax=Alteromonas aquimaris TaxID=2998417 RepID=A0ABT3P7E6_9ALTE|nr:DNA polymerase III subunit delta' [Alteromonas aquimaris]MCW8108698.1 DNA polymerase III subunit delta' [Alteromonas aquimaris]
MLPWFVSYYHTIVSRLSANRLHHALLLAGTEGIGKLQLAEHIAKFMLCKMPVDEQACQRCQSCQLFAAGTHPDFHILQSERQIGVDLVREGISKLSRTSQLSGNKVLIIPAAESMTEAAANALLKTLEEPTANTYLILVTHQLSRMLPTILSRCEKHVLVPPSTEQSLSWLKQQGMGEVTEAQLHAYGNAPLKVQRSLSTESGIQYTDFVAALDNIIAGKGDEMQFAGEWQDEAKRVVSWCQHYVHQLYIRNQSQSAFSVYNECIKAHVHLQNPGVNKKLVLSTLLAQFSHLDMT